MTHLRLPRFTGSEAQQLMRTLRSRPGMPNFLLAETVQEAAALLQEFFQNLRVELRSRPKWKRPEK